MKKYLLMLGLSFNCLYAVKIDNIDAFSSMIKAAEKEEVLEYILNCDESYTSLLTPDKKLYWKDKLDTESLNRIFRDVTEALYQKLSQERFDDIEQKIEDARTHFINIAIQKEQEAQETNKTKQELI